MTTTFSIDELFTPVQSGVSLDPNIPPPDSTWLGVLLTNATTLGLDTTAWQPGGPERTLLAVSAVADSQEDVLISVMAQGGFLDSAASGVVSYVALDGTTVTQPVTPDPSIPSQNPTGAPGWLDVLGQSFFREERLQATQATGQLAIVKTTAGTISYVAGNYHVGNVVNGATYSNASALSLPSSSIAGSGGVVTGVTTGTPTTLITTSAAHGLAVGDVVYVTGTSGVTGLNGQFAAVTSAPTTTTLQIALTTTGTWTSGGTVYKCTVATFTADVVGIGSNAAPGQVTTTITTNPGVSVANLAAWSASNYESNKSYAARLRLKWASISPNGPSQAYDYFALSAVPKLAAQTPAVTLTNGAIEISTTFSNPQTGVVTTLVSSTTPASTVLGAAVTPGCSNLNVTNATNATPIVVTTASAHGLSSGDFVTIAGVLGNTNANGTNTITVASSTTFHLDNTTGNGAYTGGGQVDGGDLGQIDALLEANVTPDNATHLTQSALAFPVTVVATIVVPQANVASYQSAAPAALVALLKTYPIGGNIPTGASDGTVPISAIEGTLFEAGSLVPGAASVVLSITGLTINGGTADLTYPTPDYVAILATPTLNVVGV